MSVAISRVKNNARFSIMMQMNTYTSLNGFKLLGFWVGFFLHLKIDRKQSWQKRRETARIKDCEDFMLFNLQTCVGRLWMSFYGLMTYQTVAWGPYLQPSWPGQTLQSVMTHQFSSHFLGLTLHQLEGDHLWQKKETSRADKMNIVWL